MEVNYGTVDFINIERAFDILRNITNNGDSISPEEISKIAVDSHKEKYLLPLSKGFGSLFKFAIETLKFKEALFFIQKGITIIDSEEEIIKSIDLAEQEYLRLNILDKAKELFDMNPKVFQDIYEREVLNYEALNKLKELYPVKKRVLV